MNFYSLVCAGFMLFQHYVIFGPKPLKNNQEDLKLVKAFEEEKENNSELVNKNIEIYQKIDTNFNMPKSTNEN